MKYFAYGSNMSLQRLQQRVPSAQFISLVKLIGHQLKFHKRSDDGSGKCDALATQQNEDIVWGALFEFNDNEKAYLDKVEGVGSGYEIKQVTLLDSNDTEHQAYMYYATDIKQGLKPYSWYLNHVVIGAKEIGVPAPYLALIESREAEVDPDKVREQHELSVHQ